MLPIAVATVKTIVGEDVETNENEENSVSSQPEADQVRFSYGVFFLLNEEKKEDQEPRRLPFEVDLDVELVQVRRFHPKPLRLTCAQSHAIAHGITESRYD